MSNTTGLTSSERGEAAVMSRAEPSVGYCLSSTSPPDFSAAPAAARDRDRSRRHDRPGRAAAVLVVGLVLLGAAAAEAQTSRILVSNTAVADDDTANTSGNDHAQLFHTGGHTGGYVLTSVFLNSEDTEGDDFDVEICEEDGSADEFPSSTCTALTAPSSFTAALLQFTHAGLALSANTNYVVVIKQLGTGSVRFKSTTNTGEDTSLGLSGWSIKDKFYWKSGSTWMIKSGSNEALRIVVVGYEVAAVTVTDATLSALSVSGATLSPAFDAGTTSYSTTVANAVSQVTITETKSESTATVEYLDGSDNTRTDADTMTAGLQVNLSVGTNTVKVKVTAPDTTTTQTYTVNILRVAVPVACSAASIPNRIWTGNLTVGTGTNEVGFSAFGGSLDNTNFSYKGTSYTIEFVTIPFGIALQIGLSAALGASTNDLVLHVGTEQYAFADATFAPIETGYGWFSNFPSWADGDAVCLALTVDGPDVSSVEITSVSIDATNGIGDAVEATVTFSAAVDITGSPQLELDFASTAKAAACTTATNTTTMVCSYTVAVGDVAAGGVAIAANKLTLNGGTITATGSTTVNADLDHGAVLIDANHKVDGIRPTLVTTGSDAPTTSTDGTQVILTFSENLGSVDRTKITIGIGGGNVAQTSAARVVGTEVELDLSTIIDATVMLTVALGGVAVLDTASNGNLAVPATPVINAITDDPVVSSVALTSTPGSDNTYGIGDAVEATVTFSAAVDITGTPQLELDFAGTAKAATCTAATNTTTMACSYTVVENDSAPNGIAIAANKLTGGTITATGSTTNNADLDHVAVMIDAGHKVDGIRPTLVTTGSDAPKMSTDGTKIILFFNEFIGTVDRTKITVKSGTTTQATPLGSVLSGPRLEIALATALTSADTAVTVELGTDAVTDGAGNGNLAVAATAVTNALGAPDVPHSLDATPGNRQVMLSWVLPSGGAALTHYEYEQDGSGTWISTGGTATDYTVTGLTNGQPYTFKVRALNSAGASAASAASPSVTPATVPGAPTGLSATVSDRRVDLIWTAPASNGGQSITGYEYEQAGSGTWISTGGPATSTTVRNLTNGQPYRFRVRAVNRVGAGAASAASPNVTPATEPDAPTGLSATVSDQRVDLIWTAPASNGGAPILRYEYELDFSGTWISTGGPATSTTVRNLTNGQSYTFQVRAVNRVGAGAASGSQSATPTSTLVAPDTPFGLSATPGNRQVRLSWVQPSGGAALTHYEYEQDGSGTWISTGGTAPSHTVTGLNNGQPYTFRVRAVNSAGASAASGSRTATPTTTEPEAPESLSATPGDGQVTLRWRAPTNDGGEPITHYEYELDGSGTWISTGSTATSRTVTGLNNGQTYTFRVRAVNALGNGAVVTLQATPSPSTGGGGGDGGTPRTSVPGAVRNLTAAGGNGEAVLSWDAPSSDGGAEITDYEVRINRSGPWISTGSTETTHTVTGLDNGTTYVFQVRAVNRIGKGRVSNRAEATPEVFTLDFAHFANGDGLTSDLVFVNVGTHPIRPALYFYDQEGQPMAAESVVDITGDLEFTEDGGLSIQTAMEPLGELTISTHGQGGLVSGSVRVVAGGPLGGVLRFDLPGIGVAGVGVSSPVRDAIFPVRRQEAGINTGVAIHNLESSAEIVRCELMREGVLHDAVSIPLAANGQSSWFIDAAFPAADTSGFVGSVRCDAEGSGMFTAVALELDAARRIFTTLPVLSTRRAGGRAAELNFAHFANGAGLTSDLVFVNLSTERSRPAPTPYHSDILPVRPALYFYDTEGALVSAESVVDITGDLEVMEDGGLTVQTEMEPLGVLTISTHGRGELVSGSVRVVADEPIGGALRFDLPGIGVAGVGAGSPISDALFPVRRQEGGINTGVAVHNLGEEAMEVTCELMQGGTVLDDASIPLAANGQSSWFINEVFTGADTSDFVGSVRCTAPGEGMFTGVAVELDAVNRIFTTLPVVPVPERMSQE